LNKFLYYDSIMVEGFFARLGSRAPTATFDCIVRRGSYLLIEQLKMTASDSF